MPQPTTEPHDYLPAICYSGRDGREEARARICSRLVLYLQGLDVRALSCLDIAGESLRRAGDGACLADAYREMHGVLRERGLDLCDPRLAGGELPSVPAMERRPMLAGRIEVFSVNGWMRGSRGQVARDVAAAG